MKSYFFILMLIVCHLFSCSTHDKIDWSLIHDEKMMDRAHYGITIRPSGDTIIHSAYSIKVHFNERLDGTYKEYKNDELIYETIVVDGRLNGESKFYYSGGQFRKTVTCFKGDLHGRYLTFFENGNIKIEGHYKQSEKVGTWKYWNESGQLIRTEDY